MAEYRVTKRFEFDAAHRLLGYDGPCSRVHGHRYAVEVTVGAEALNKMAMVVDFLRIKSLLQPLLNEWDHHILLCAGDPLIPVMSEMLFVFADVPTAEAMARHVWGYMKTSMSCQAGFMGARLLNVRVYETPDCWADYCDV